MLGNPKSNSLVIAVTTACGFELRKYLAPILPNHTQHGPLFVGRDVCPEMGRRGGGGVKEKERTGAPTSRWHHDGYF